MLANQLTKLSEPETPIHSSTRLGAVDFTVADLARSVDFYTRVIGFSLLDKNEQRAILGAGTQPLLTVHERKNARRQPGHSTGLYHMAILLPSRPDLGRWLLHMERLRYPVQGFADHLVSEAVYLADPDGNGLEVYRDLPHSDWKWNGGQVQMATDPIDIEGIVTSIPDPNVLWTGAPQGTTIGHMHLRVGDIALAEAFYHRVMGFDVVAHMPSAIFLSAGGYHHHIGANIWHSRNAPPAPEDSVGLRQFTVIMPDADAQYQVVRRFEQASIPFERQDADVLVDDPWSNHIRLTVENPA
jgi:catechol 2,3-dioxygenase